MNDEKISFSFFILSSFYKKKRILKSMGWFMHKCIDHFNASDEVYIRNIFSEACFLFLSCCFIKSKCKLIRQLFNKKRIDIMNSSTYIKKKGRWLTFLNTIDNKNTDVQNNLPRYILSLIFSDSFDYYGQNSQFWNQDYTNLSQQMPQIKANVQNETTFTSNKENTQ